MNQWAPRVNLAGACLAREATLELPTLASDHQATQSECHPTVLLHVEIHPDNLQLRLPEADDLDLIHTVVGRDHAGVSVGRAPSSAEWSLCRPQTADGDYDQERAVTRVITSIGTA